MVKTFFNRLVLILGIATSNYIVSSSDLYDFQKSLDTFVFLSQEESLHTYKGMKQLFDTFEGPLSKNIKYLHNQIRALKKSLRSFHNASEEIRLKELSDLLSFLKKHKIQYEAIILHKEIVVKYQKLFDMIEDNQDVLAFISENKSMYDLDPEDTKYLQNFIKNIRKISHKISNFEDYLHADQVDLKLQNYVFKIECIKLRNSILFDKRYKQNRNR